MDETRNIKKVHQGRNVRLARIWKNMSQEMLADKLNMFQTEVSSLEQKESIDDEILEKIAKAVNVPKDFFTEFDLDANMQSYQVYDNEISMTHSDNAIGDNNTQKIVEKEENIYNPIDKVSELYERLLKSEREKVALLEEALKGKK